jgi:diguanylate cyclase (GGDEF)-like protein
VDWEKVRRPRSKAVRIASSHLITSCATIAALFLFVGLGSQVVPGAFGWIQLGDAANSLSVAFILNIAIILFGWRRSKDLREALDAHEEAERVAQRNANTDPTTGLANRRELMRSLDDALAVRSEGVLLLLDLDHFKRVNDLHGHLAGDQLLKVIAESLARTAADAACVARIGGDEFAILLAGATPAEGEKAARAVLAQLDTPMLLRGHQAQVSASIGLALLGKSSEQEDVLRRSDVALYAAKRAGRGGFAWFDEALERELTDRLKLEEDIREGVRKGEFIPFFQPLIDLETREMVGFEALARWRSPTRGLLEAEDFIERADATGLIGPLTLSIMKQALAEARDWPAHLKIAVNISPVQFRDAALAEQIIKVLAETGFPAHRLEIEITEGALLEDRDQFSTIIRSLKNVGISISLDDFGTGYASLAQLHNLPVDRIKIDKSFIATLVKSDQTAAIVQTIADLGHTLNVPITAEGVESELVHGELRRFGCAEAQGWLFGRAVSAETVRGYLAMNGSQEAAKPTPAPDSESVPKPRRRAL